MAVSGNTFALRARFDSHAGESAGSTFVFAPGRRHVDSAGQLTAPDAADNDFFGSAVAVSGDAIVVGAPGQDTSRGADAGCAYWFIRSGYT